MVPIDRFDRVECGPSARDACWRVRLHAVVRSCLYSNLPNLGLLTQYLNVISLMPTEGPKLLT